MLALYHMDKEYHLTESFWLEETCKIFESNY